MDSHKLQKVLSGIRSWLVYLFNWFVQNIRNFFKTGHESASFGIGRNQPPHQTSTSMLAPYSETEKHFKFIRDKIILINQSANERGSAQEGKELAENFVNELDVGMNNFMQAGQSLSPLNYRMPTVGLKEDELNSIYDDDSGSFGLLHALLGSKEDAYRPDKKGSPGPSFINLAALELLLRNPGAVSDSYQRIKIDNSVIQEVVRRTIATLSAGNAVLRDNRLKALKVMLQPCQHVSFDINAKSGNLGQTALHLAAFAGDVDLVKMLLETCQDVDVDLVDNSKNTALHYAAMIQNLDSGKIITKQNIISNKVEIVRLLLNKNCNRGIENSHGETAADISSGCLAVSSIINM